jgi:archaellum biogenesis ATPase FlaH
MHEQDSNLVCITISPKMMQEILENDDNKDEDVVDIIADLKSMQMCTSKVNAATYFDDALSLADKNRSLFETVTSHNDKDRKSRVVVRKRRNTVIELVMMMCDGRGFSLINFTGKIDARIIAKLTDEDKGDTSD